MTGKRQKRSSISGITTDCERSERVGGRQADRGTQPARGGYQDICTEKRPAHTDPRLRDLRAVGLPAHWLRVAEQIGFDHFLAVWQMLSENERVQDNYGRVHIPNFSTWLRHQRNRLIATLAAQGHSPQQIRDFLLDRLGYDLSLGHIRELMKS